MGKKGKYRNQGEEQDQPKKKKMMITEEHLMDKTHMDPTEFIPYLPDDSLYPPYKRINNVALKKIVLDLNYLLYVDFKVFWATVLYNPSLKICLCSCLQNLHRKSLNIYAAKSVNQEDLPCSQLKDTEQLQLTQALFKVVLLIYHRLTHQLQQNKQLSELYKLPEQVSRKYMLDIPRLIELIEIYGHNNQEIVGEIIRGFLKAYGGEKDQKSATIFYQDFVSDVMGYSLERLNTIVGVIKKISDREEFGIEYSYKRTAVNELSPGEEQLQKKIKLLMELVTFYDTINNIQKFFPKMCGEYIRSSDQLHQFSENVFIQIEQAYKIWSYHDMGFYILPLMNKILTQIRDYFIDFFRTCEGLLLKQNMKSSVIGSYIKCFDRMIEMYGRRNSLGKKAMLNKRYLELYQEILREYKLDDLLTGLYVEQIENETHGINIEYLVDFKIAIEELLIKMNGRDQPASIQNQIDLQGDDETEIGMEDMEIEEPIRKYSNMSYKSNMSQKMGEQEKQLDKLEVLISKKNREQNYYERLYSEYRTKITVQYDDEYDDLVDYQKRPMFEDDVNEREGSSDAESQFDSQEEKLHLVKSISNVSRARVYHQSHDPLSQAMNQHKKQHHQEKGLHGAKHQRGTNKQIYRDSTYHQKSYKNKKPKYEPVKEKEAKQVIQQYGQKNKIQDDNNKKKYEEKQQPSKKPTYTQKKKEQQKIPKEYQDQECFQECRARIKTEQKMGEQEMENEGQSKGQSTQNKGRKQQRLYKRKNDQKNKYKSKYVPKQ